MEPALAAPMLFLPLAVVNVWRVATWVLTVVVLAKMVTNANQPVQSQAWSIGRIALAAFMISDFLLNAQLWGQPATWEGLPLTTAGVILAAFAAWSPQVPRDDASV